MSSLVTLASPGVAADSNGLFHGLGDHAENSFSLDGQPITDQQSKVFSNQIPLDAVQSMEVISGAPPAEFGDKTSLVIDVTTRSGLGVNHAARRVTASYGTFGSSNLDANFAYGGKKWGNFIAANGLNTGRFLDPPEFSCSTTRATKRTCSTASTISFRPVDAIHLNVGYTRSWFQTPNSYDNLNVNADGTPLTAWTPVGPTDQRSKIGTFNIAPTWTHTLSPNAVFTLGAFVRRDAYNYYPSDNPFADLGPIQQETIAQNRTLTNAGALANVTYTKGIHNIKAGITYEQTFLNENDQLGIVDPTLNSPCVDADGRPAARFHRSVTVRAAGFQPNPRCSRILSCYDLTRLNSSRAMTCRAPGGTLYRFERPHRRQRTRDVRSGHHHEAELDIQPGDSRRSV